MLQIKITAHEVAKSMYVANFDQPWMEIPFPFQGFLVAQESELRSLQKHFNHDLIDVEKGIAPYTSRLGRSAQFAAPTET